MAGILVLEGLFHLGDNPAVFLNANYIGHRLALPVKKTWHDNASTEVKFSFFTHDVETWGASQGHTVFINGTEIGRLKDAADAQGKIERFDVSILTADFVGLLNGSDNFELALGLERSAANPGLADDFVLTRIETENVAVALGWK